MMVLLSATIAFFAYLCTILRLLSYQKEGAKYRRNVSIIAWLILVILAGSMIDVLMNLKKIGIFEAARATLLAIVVFRVRGNVSRLIWSNKWL